MYQGTNLVNLDNCKKDAFNILNCSFPKEHLDIIAIKENSFRLYFFDAKTGYSELLNLAKPIKIFYQDIQ